MTKEIVNKTKKGFYWTFLLKIPYESFRFFISIVIARILDPKDFGIVSIATMLIYYSNTLTNLGFNHALVQREDITKDHINSVFTIDIAISIVMSLLFYLSSDYIATFFNSSESSQVIKILAIVFIITTFHELPYSLLRRDLNYKVISIIDTSREIVISTLTLILALNGLKYWSIVWGQLIPLVLASIYLCRITKWRPIIKYDHQSVKQLLGFGLWSFIRSQIYFISTRIDRIFLGKIFGPEILGIYDKAKSFSQMPGENIVNLLSIILFPAFSRIQDNKIEANKMLRTSIMSLSILVFPIYFGLYCIAESFILVLLGEKWTLAIVPLQFLCVVGLFHTLNSPIEAFLTGTGSYKEYTKRQIVATIVLIISLAIIVRWGINYIAIGLLLHSIILLVFNIRLLKSKIGLKYIDIIHTVFPALVCSIAMFLILKFITLFYFKEPNIITLVSLVGIGLIVYLVSILIIPGKEMESIKALFIKDFKKLIGILYRKKDISE